MNTVDWLLDSDPAIRWQAMRDLTDASATDVATERSRVAHEGLGAQILASQSPDGGWPHDGVTHWLPTLFMPLLLRSTGVERTDSTVRAAMTRLAGGFRWHESLGGKPFFEGEIEPCINGGALALGGYFGHPSHDLARRLLDEQLEDGGWNCDAPKSARSSYHTTICVLEGLLEYERAVGPDVAVTAARKRAEAYLLERSLFRRLSTGAVANPEFLELAFPPRYHYDVLRGLEYFMNAGVRPDERMKDAVSVVERKRIDGRFPLERTHRESLSVQLDEQIGEPSRWITLRALRVLRWWTEPRQ